MTTKRTARTAKITTNDDPAHSIGAWTHSFTIETSTIRLDITVNEDGSLTIHSDGTMIIYPRAPNAVVVAAGG